MTKKILIIEDEISLRQAIKDKLTNEGFEVIQANTGLSGAEIALKEKPDLILLDIVMPGGDGFSAADKIRNDEWGKKAKIIILTNLNSQEQVMNAFRNDIHDFYVKTDIKIQDLVNRIKEKLV